MPAGLQVFDASGNLIGDVSTSYGRYIGIIDTASYPGNSFSDAALGSGRPWYMRLEKPYSGGLYGPIYSAINIQISGTTISWVFQLTRKDCYILYGVY